MTPINNNSVNNSNLSGYDVRPATREKSNVSRKQHTRAKSCGRQVLTPSQSASMVQDEGHNCTHLNTEHTGVKVTARLCLSLFLFTFAYALNSTISRGPTRLNGSQAHCGGTCQSAHAALTPSLCDDMLVQIGKKLGEVAFHSLDVIHRKYLERRFKLSEEDIGLLSSEDKHVRSAHLEKIISRLTMKEKWGTYIDTPTDFARNVTYDNHCDSNRFDIYLEKHLRKKEDNLAKLCTANEITPIEALEQLQTEYRKVVDVAISSLKAKKAAIAALRQAHNELMVTKIESEEYFSKVDSYLNFFHDFFEKKQGAPGLKKLKTKLTSHPSQAVLKKASSEKSVVYVTNNARQLLPLEKAENKFNKAERTIERRLKEAERQILVLHQTTDEIKIMFKALFQTIKVN